MTILLLEDKLGITQGYMDLWESLALGCGLNPQEIRRYSVWKSPIASRMRLLTRKGNRKSPGFNPEITGALHNWLGETIKHVKPRLIILMDVALLGLIEESWDIATIDNLRGSVYNYRGIPLVVTTPISAVHSQKKPKDIRAMNEGAESKDDFERRQESGELEEEELFVEPYTIPFGKRILSADLRKCARILQRGIEVTPTRMNIRLVQSKYDAKEALDFLMGSALIANDIETLPDVGLMNVNGYTGLHSSGEIATYVFPLYVSKAYTSGTPVDLDSYLHAMARINLSGIPFTFHNGAYDLFWLLRYGLPVANYAYDSMTMFWSLFPEYPKTLAFVSSVLLDDHVYWKGDRKSDDWTTHLIYNGKDNHRTVQCTIRLIELLLRDRPSLRNFHAAHSRVLTCLGMSTAGMRADEERLAEHGAALAIKAADALARVRYLVADEQFNPNSPPQKIDLLYKKLGVRPRNAKGRLVKKIEDGSSGAVALRAIRSEHPIFRRVANGIMEALEPAKQISNVIGIKRTRWGRFYTSYNGVGTTTSRLSSSEAPIKVGGNAQNLRKEYRDWLVADPDSFLLDIDFSAADDVFVSFESGDPRKIELFRTGRDSHSQNSTLFFPNWTYESVVSGKKLNDPKVIHPITGIRQITKKLSHGCNYLMAGMTLLMTAGREAIVAAAKEVGYSDAGGWTQDRLVEFCESRENLYRGYYTRFRREGPDSWYSDLWKEFQETGGFLTPFQYFQRFLGDKNDRNILRGLAATAGQAGTAGRVNMAMDELTHGFIPPEFRDAPNPDWGSESGRISLREHGISFRLQTHDSFTFNVNYKHPNWEQGVDNIYRVLHRPVVIRNKLTHQDESFVVGLESECGLAWGKGLTGFKGNSLAALKITLAEIGIL